MVDIFAKPFMKYANETHTGVFEVPLSNQNEILDTGIIKNASAVKKRIADKNKIAEDFGLKTSLFINPKKVVDEKYGLGITAEKNKEAVYKWRKTPAGQDKYNEYQMKLYKEMSANDEWRLKYNERAREANRRWREKKANEDGRTQKKKEREEARLAKIANKKPVGRPAKRRVQAIGYNPQTKLNTKVRYANRSTYELKNPRKQIGKGMFDEMYDEGIEFCDKPYYDSTIFI
jgi:hypothetical protein